jgi:hypothetical protein
MSKEMSWRAIADLLARRLYYQAYCEDHPDEAAFDPRCPNCSDRAAVRLYEAKAGVSAGPVVHEGPAIPLHEIPETAFNWMRPR